MQFAANLCTICAQRPRVNVNQASGRAERSERQKDSDSEFSSFRSFCEERKFIVNNFFGYIRLQEDTETFRDNPRPSGMNSFFIKRSFYYYTCCVNQLSDRSIVG